MERVIDDAGYIEYLGTPIRRRQYMNWRQRMLPQVEGIAQSFVCNGFAATMETFRLTRRDAVLLRRLGYLHPSEVPDELEELAREMPL